MLRHIPVYTTLAAISAAIRGREASKHNREMTDSLMLRSESRVIYRVLQW